MTDVVIAIIVAAGIPSAVVGLLVWNFQRKITRLEKEKEEVEKKRIAEQERKEQDRERLMIYLLENSNAAIALSMATAKAVQRIPDAHCNGDMHKALEHADSVRHKHKDFLIERGIHSIM